MPLTTTHQLNTAGQWITWAVRRWMCCAGRAAECRSQLTEGFRIARMEGGLLFLDRLLVTFAVAAPPGLAICPLRCRRLGADEQLLLDVLGGYQIGADGWAEELLGELLPPAGVRWAGEAAQGLALMMRAARLEIGLAGFRQPAPARIGSAPRVLH